ncbi:HTH-type transcriptional repressor GlcR [subsurface metagenome]|nr:DeoR family transcriptional regulator [Clostridia bacterium]
MVKDKEDLFIEERRNEIVKYIEKVEKATIEDIIKLLKISKSTVRRDLIDLERKNLIIRTRGGALKKRYFKYEFSLNEKKDLNLDKKKKIAQIAKRFINEGNIIYISGGTTTLELAKILFDIKDLIVFTNAINILLELANNSGIEIKLVGGDFRKKTFSMVGQEAINYLDRYNFDKAFVGVNGISVSEGFTTPNELEAIVDGEVIKRSKEAFILADETKFGAVAFSNICKIEDVDYIITNKSLNSNLAKEIKKDGVKIVCE